MQTLYVFKQRIQQEKPFAADVKLIDESEIYKQNFKIFEIKASQEKGDIITEICPDISICPDCANELKADTRRKNYPFNNCSHCGPRFTIVKDFPYDRERTSMKEFRMCTSCKEEYSDPANRRFHAQPVSCPDCGPVYSYVNNEIIITENEQSVIRIAAEINDGKVVAIKGLGGYNLACDAFNTGAVRELRQFKHREKKPFAVLFRSMEHIETLAEIDYTEREALQSWQRPIVILKLKSNLTLSPEITSGLPTIGAFLPYLPLQYILFANLKTNAIVLTSGNTSDTPIICKDNEAIKTFKDCSGGILTNNREIVRRIDDSVIRVIDSKPILFRRARGYVPAPVDLDFNVDGILAAGAELSNCFCLGKNRQAIMSQHIGDLQNLETYEFFCNNIREFSNLYRTPIHTIACDLHPDYLSTRYAEESVFNVIYTQHHHAHIASVMAEHGLRGPVIGLSYDGTGLGTDGNIWGSEALITDFQNFSRISHYEYIRMQGGDENIAHPWRTALATLHHFIGTDWIQTEIPFLQLIDKNKALNLAEAIKKNINCNLCCSAGRLFDAISALLDICLESNNHAEAPMLLENYINPAITGHYNLSGSEIISFKEMLKEIIADLMKREHKEVIITRFHNTIAQAACSQAEFARKITLIDTVVLSGGCFQNKYLTEKLLYLLKDKGFNVYLPHTVPINDGGIALGQLAIAAHKTN